MGNSVTITRRSSGTASGTVVRGIPTCQWTHQIVVRQAFPVGLENVTVGEFEKTHQAHQVGFWPGNVRASAGLSRLAGRYLRVGYFLDAVHVAVGVALQRE